MGSLTSTATETAGVAGAGPRLRHRLRGVLVIGAVVLAAAAAAVTIAHLFASTASVKGVAGSASLATVTRQDLPDQARVAAALGRSDHKISKCAGRTRPAA